MTAIAAPIDVHPAAAKPSARRLFGLYLLLGFAAGLPFYMFNAVLTLRLSKHGVDIVIIGFFAWIALLPTFKFAWAPLVEKYDVPGFARFWGRRRQPPMSWSRRRAGSRTARSAAGFCRSM